MVSVAAAVGHSVHIVHVVLVVCSSVVRTACNLSAVAAVAVEHSAVFGIVVLGMAGFAVAAAVAVLCILVIADAVVADVVQSIPIVERALVAARNLLRLCLLDYVVRGWTGGLLSLCCFMDTYAGKEWEEWYKDDFERKSGIRWSRRLGLHKLQSPRGG